MVWRGSFGSIAVCYAEEEIEVAPRMALALG